MSEIKTDSTDSPDRDSWLNNVIIPVGVSGPVIEAFAEVDRAQFMPRAERHMAYTDQIIDLTPDSDKTDSTISQPSFVAKMVDLLNLEGRERVLEIGTATGYQAALLSRLAGHVHTIEIDKRLAYWARSNLKRLHYSNVTVHEGDGAMGISEDAPFDAIIVTAGLREVPKTLLDQLAVGGRLVVPLGELPELSTLTLITKLSKTELDTKTHGPCQFVPFFSSELGGWTAEELGEIRSKRRKEREDDRLAYRVELKEFLIKHGGGNGYRELMKYIAGPVAEIMESGVTEEQALELFGFFRNLLLRPEEGEDEQTDAATEFPSSTTDAREKDVLTVGEIRQA